MPSRDSGCGDGAGVGGDTARMSEDKPLDESDACIVSGAPMAMPVPAGVLSADSAFRSPPPLPPLLPDMLARPRLRLEKGGDATRGVVDMIGCCCAISVNTASSFAPKEGGCACAPA